MKTLYVLVEGQTEERFVKKTLYEHLLIRGVAALPIIVETSHARSGKKRKGGGDWTRRRLNLEKLVHGHPGGDTAFTTLFDLYAFPRKDFPAMAEIESIQNTVQRAELLEAGMLSEVGDTRFLPYVQRHEFEALVLVGIEDLKAFFLDSPRAVKCIEALQTSIGDFGPEDIDDGPETAPSKRLRSIPGYQKDEHGPLAIECAGLAKLRARCPRFAAWLTRLEALGESSPAPIVVQA